MLGGLRGVALAHGCVFSCWSSLRTNYFQEVLMLPPSPLHLLAVSEVFPGPQFGQSSCPKTKDSSD